MKLDLSKTEKKGFLWGMSYVVTAKVHLTAEEAALVKKHMPGWVLVEDLEGITPNPLLQEKLLKKAVRLDHYTRGVEIELSSIQEAGNLESAIVQGCKVLKEQVDAVGSHSESMGRARTVEF